MANISQYTVDQSTRLATRRPQQCARFFLQSIYPALEQESWFDKSWCLKFCAAFLQNLLDQSIEQEVCLKTVNRLRAFPLSKAIPLMSNDPEGSVKIMVVLVSDSLRKQQKLSTEEQYEFYNALLQAFFFDDSPLNKGEKTDNPISVNPVPPSPPMDERC